jgi:hypothetical protein
VALSIPGKLSWRDIKDAPLVHLGGGDQPFRHEVALPLRRVRVDLV